ncbi:MAG: DUF4037 domain-containing protein [Lachnospiraceae bacterium]|nr:DUF4037 domain-containing protein [Lachnospiraceae bacterium]
MDIKKVLEQYDEMMSYKTEVELQVFLMDNLAAAKKEGDKRAQITLNNELVGITRRTGDKTAAVNACYSVISLMKELELTDTVDYVVALINVGTTYRIFGIMDEAKKALTKAGDCIEEQKIEDPSVLALYHNNFGLLYADRQEFRHAKMHLEKALLITSSHDELSANSDITRENLNKVNEQLSITQLEKCRRFYERYGAPMIESKFSEYKDRIAVGLVGEGSECFGFDDDLSRDHDFVVGFCMWLNDDDYREIGGILQHEYELLVENYGDGGMNLHHVALRRGVFTVRDFYRSIMQIPEATIEKLMSGEDLNTEDWINMKEEHMATVTNGEIFFTGDGIFQRVREALLRYYPDRIWRMNLAHEVHIFSQSGQYNYPRMMARGDYVTATICLSRALTSAMKIFYLLNKSYAPYYKWRRRGLENFGNTAEALKIMDKIAVSPMQAEAWSGDYNPYVLNRGDNIVLDIEDLALEILNLMKDMGLVDGENTFLDIYCDRILGRG